MENEAKKIHEDYYIDSHNFNYLRLLWVKELFFKDVLKKNILEIGCGDGGVIQYLKDKNNVFGIDISKNAINILNQKGIQSHLADISSEILPFDDNTFDYVIMLETIEHLKSPQNAIEEIQRVLKKDGMLVISVPNPRTLHKLIYPCLFQYSNFRDYLLLNGFKIKKVTTYGICPPFWKFLKPLLDYEYTREKNNLLKKNVKTENAPFLTKISRFFSSEKIKIFIPKIFSWSFVFFCINVDPSGAKNLYKKIAEETKKANR